MKSHVVVFMADERKLEGLKWFALNGKVGCLAASCCVLMLWWKSRCKRAE